MDGVKHSRMEQLPAKHKCWNESYEYTRRDFIPRGEASQCVVSVYEIPPGKSAFPYHYHHKNEETFYILSGEGCLKTPEGERDVSAGDLLFFPANASGAHKLTNTSSCESLIYLDFDTANDLDAAIYPDSNKIGIWGKGVNRVYRLQEDVDYYDGE